MICSVFCLSFFLQILLLPLHCNYFGSWFTTMDGKTYLDFMKIVLICLLWYLCSTSDNILGKVVLSSFPYPMTVTLTHLTIAAVFLGPIKSFMRVPSGAVIDKKYYYTMILPLALGKFVSSVSSYISIWKVSVSYAHTGRKTCHPFSKMSISIFLQSSLRPLSVSIIWSVFVVAWFSFYLPSFILSLWKNDKFRAVPNDDRCHCLFWPHVCPVTPYHQTCWGGY